MDEKKAVQLVLVSQSPRRKELIKRLGLPFICVEPGHLHEHSHETLPQPYTIEIAQDKMNSVLAEQPPFIDKIWISADTIVVYQDRFLGKPQDQEEAFRMLETLSGQWHQVYTGVVIHVCLDGQEASTIQFCEETRVKFRQVPSSMLQRIIHSENVLDKAGAYAIQDLGGLLVERIIGDYYNVMGFPVGRIWEALIGLDVY